MNENTIPTIDKKAVKNEIIMYHMLISNSPDPENCFANHHDTTTPTNEIKNSFGDFMLVTTNF